MFDELIQWNTSVGDVINDEIVTAWENALAAAKKYGSYVEALGSIDADIEAAGGEGGPNYTVGKPGDFDNTNARETVSAIVNAMRQVGAKWSPDNSVAQNNAIHDEVAKLAARLPASGVEVMYNSATGEWIITKDKLNPANAGKVLTSVYHSGGIAGGVGTMKENELLAKLEDGEVVVSNRNKQTLFDLIDFVGTMMKHFEASPLNTMPAPVPLSGSRVETDNIYNNQRSTVRMGDVYIYGASNDTVEKHRAINRELANEVFKQLNIKR